MCFISDLRSSSSAIAPFVVSWHYQIMFSEKLLISYYLVQRETLLLELKGRGGAALFWELVLLELRFLSLFYVVKLYICTVELVKARSVNFRIPTLSQDYYYFMPWKTHAFKIDLKQTFFFVSILYIKITKLYWCDIH